MYQSIDRVTEHSKSSGRWCVTGAAAEFAVETAMGHASTRWHAPHPTFAGIDLYRPALMGVVNVTPDSFSDGGQHADPTAACQYAQQLVRAGAATVDFGGESTRPGAAPVTVAAELDRVIPAIAAFVATQPGVPVSIDTRNAPVAEAAIAAGASIVNDVSALGGTGDVLAVVAESSASVVLMHARGTPATMQVDPTYDDVLREVYEWLAARVTVARQLGIAPHRIAVDPGIGFGKTLAHNIALLRGLSRFHDLGCAVVLGCSRKGFIGKLAGEPVAPARTPGSVAAALWGVSCGVQILRVHDVAETAQALAVWWSLAQEVSP